jgi:arsenate reductase (thioredoxin)
MTHQPLRVLFLSRRNTARSLMAEALMNQLGGGRFIARSAGAEAGEPDPLTFQELEKDRFDTAGLHPKTLDDLLATETEPFDFIFSLCDTAHHEQFPEWPGHPVSAHWSCEDPLLIDEPEFGKPVIYGRVLAELERRISIFMQLPFETLDRISLQHHVDQMSHGPTT